MPSPPALRYYAPPLAELLLVEADAVIYGGTPAGVIAAVPLAQPGRAYHQGMMWCLGHQPRVPQRIDDIVGALGLPRDEFIPTGGWPHQPYVREALR